MDIEFDAITKIKKKKGRNPLATLHPKSEDQGRPVKIETESKKQREVETKKRKETEAKKIKEAARIDALFAAAGTREKVLSPKGKKNTTPVKPTQDFFKPSPKSYIFGFLLFNLGITGRRRDLRHLRNPAHRKRPLLKTWQWMTFSQQARTNRI